MPKTPDRTPRDDDPTSARTSIDTDQHDASVHVPRPRAPRDGQQNDNTGFRPSLFGI